MCGKVPKSVKKCRDDFAQLLPFSFSLIDLLENPRKNVENVKDSSALASP